MTPPALLSRLKAMAKDWDGRPWLEVHTCIDELEMLVSQFEGESPNDDWQPMDTIPETGQVIVCWADEKFDTIGRGEYLEILGYGENPARGWMPLPSPPSVTGETT